MSTNQFNPTNLPCITNLAGLNNLDPEHLSPMGQARPKVKVIEKTKIELELKDAFKLADIVRYFLDFVGEGCLMPSERYLVKMLIKKLRNAQPEVQF